MTDDDFKKMIDSAADAAAKTADEKTKEKFDAIFAQADDLAGIFQALKLADAAAYEQLVAVVESATKKNESIGCVVDRLLLLGKVGEKLAKQVANLSTGGAVGTVLNILGTVAAKNP